VDTYDCFPQWDPTDGSEGNWNALYDSISLRNSTHVWVDHSRFEDRATADSTLPVYFGRLFQVHDGQLDITNASDLVTVSWNRFENHEKVMLIGSSDSATGDRGKLRVTIHHNLFGDISQRGPRVRFGQVHMYNNYYKLDATPKYQYAWGVGKESAIYAENNFFRTDKDLTADMYIKVFSGTAIHVSGTFVNGKAAADFVDLVELYNAAKDPDLGTDVGWTPSLFINLQPTLNVQGSVQGHSGPFDLTE
jgi:pectate lyase